MTPGLDRAAWIVSAVGGPLLWISGVRLFLRSSLSARRRILWSLFLIAVGIALGAALPLRAIRDRFLILLAVLPVLAWIDVRLARSRRALSFWVRACDFEVCTVFGTAALARWLIGLRV